LSITTLRPLGPRVTLTALARMSTPRSIFSRASALNLTSFAAIFHSSIGSLACWCWMKPSGGLLLCALGFNHAHYVAFLHDQEVFPIEPDLSARPLAEQDAITRLDVEFDQLAIFIAAASTDSNDFALAWLFFGSVRDDDATSRLFLGFKATHENSIVQWTERHIVLLKDKQLLRGSTAPARCPERGAALQAPRYRAKGLETLFQEARHKFLALALTRC